MIDVIKGEGSVKGRKPPVVFQFGSDTYEIVKEKLQNTLRDMEEWKDVIISTDFPKGA